MKPRFEKLAKQACDAMLIGQKPNPGVERAMKRYGKRLDGFLKNPKKIPEKILKDLKDHKYGPLIAEIDKKLVVKKTIGETIQIRYVESCPDAVKLMKLIREECWRRGCAVFAVAVSDADSRRALQLLPKESLVEWSPLSEAIVRNIDVNFFIGYTEDRNWSSGLEKKKILAAPVGMKLHKIFDDRKIRWCFLGIPVKMKSKDYVVPRQGYERAFYESLAQTYKKETKELCDYYSKAMRGTDKVRITAKDGTDLIFSIKGRPTLPSMGFMTKEDVMNGDVGLNIPDGEVFIAPKEYSANGKILFDYVFPSGAGLIKNLWVHFKNGKVVKYSADGDGAKRFKKFLDSNSGEKDRIAELGIGTNKKARFVGAILIDEKIFGTIHIAIGNNRGAYHGKNIASSHLDMIKQMKGNGGDMYFDNKLVMKNGLPIHYKKI